MHIVDPTCYPLSADAVYEPSPHTLSDALAFEASVNISNIVIVQPSIYGNDNSCLLDALRVLGPKRARAVVTFDPSTIGEATLKQWHELGVRGVRINLQSVGRTLSHDEMKALLHRYADIVRPLAWIIQLYVPLRLVEHLEKIVPGLGVKVCIDHLGHPPLPSPEETNGQAHDSRTLPGFASLLRLLEGGSTFVKISAPYRISKTAHHRDLEPLARDIIRAGGRGRVVFATDWPHTRFEGLDIRPWIEQVMDWCDGDQALVERIFRGNAEELWGVR